MPIEGILDLQRRSVQLGEIRIGTSVAVDGKNYRRPVRLETFRFTTASEHTANVIAAKYGGTVAPWTQRKGRWEVITDRTALDVWVPPRGEAVDANMELWDGPKCLRRCNGITERIGNEPCLCPHPDDPSDPASVQQARDERKRLAALRPPQACKPLTRINVTIPDLPGLTGVFRLNTGSENAAVETADSGDAMAIAREGGVYLPAVLRFEWRIRSADGSPYPVPVLHIGLSMQELAAGALPAGPSGLLAQLQGSAPGEQRRALTTGTTPTPAPTAAAVPPQRPAPRPDRFAAVISAIRGAEIAVAAQRIADAVVNATTPKQMKALAALGDELGVLDDPVCTDDDNDIHEILREFWRARWVELGNAAQARTVPAESVQDAFPETEMVP
jgi:hypothetical protein